MRTKQKIDAGQKVFPLILRLSFLLLLLIGRAAEAVDLEQAHKEHAQGAAHHHADEQKQYTAHFFAPFLLTCFSILRRSKRNMRQNEKQPCIAQGLQV